MLTIKKNSKKINQSIFTHLNFEDDCYKLLNDKGEIIGYLDYIYSEKTRVIYICMFEILEPYRGKGYGSDLIDSLFDKHPTSLVIEGNSLSESCTLSFWKRNNAIFKNCIYCSNYENCPRKISKDFYCDIPKDLHFTIFKG